MNLANDVRELTLLGRPTVKEFRGGRWPDTRRRASYIETKKQHGLFRPWAFPRQGIACITQRILPILDMRAAYEKQNGKPMSFAFLMVGHSRNPVSAEDSPTAPQGANFQWCA